MNFFRYAYDYYGGRLAEHLRPAAALLILLLTLLFIGIHLLRRSRGQPVSTDIQDPLAYGQGKVARYEIGARLYHWGNFAFLFGLIISGIALYDPDTLFTPPITWLLIHEICAGLFIVGLILHIVVASFVKGQSRTMWFERRDWRDIKLIFANFIGLTRDYPSFGKYDPWQKIYHAFITLLSAVVIWTGVFLFLSAEVLATFTHNWMRWQRLLHDLAAAAFVAVIVGHIYFGLIRVNWPYLISLFTGKVSARFMRLYHSPKRWRGIKDERGLD